MSSVNLCFSGSGGLFACYWIPLAISLRSLMFEVCRRSLGVEDELEVIDSLGKHSKAKKNPRD